MKKKHIISLLLVISVFSLTTGCSKAGKKANTSNTVDFHGMMENETEEEKSSVAQKTAKTDTGDLKQDIREDVTEEDANRGNVFLNSLGYGRYDAEKYGILDMEDKWAKIASMESVGSIDCGEDYELPLNPVSKNDIPAVDMEEVIRYILETAQAAGYDHISDENISEITNGRFQKRLTLMDYVEEKFEKQNRFPSWEESFAYAERVILNDGEVSYNQDLLDFETAYLKSNKEDFSSIYVVPMSRIEKMTDEEYAECVKNAVMEEADRRIVARYILKKNGIEIDNDLLSNGMDIMNDYYDFRGDAFSQVDMTDYHKLFIINKIVEMKAGEVSTIFTETNYGLEDEPVVFGQTEVFG